MTVKLREDVVRARRFRGQIALTAHLATGEIVQVLGPSIAGRIPAAVEASPSELHLGFVNVGDNIGRHIALRSPAGKAFSIANISTESNCTRAHVKSSSPECIIVEFQQKVATIGRQTISVLIDVSIHSDRPQRLEVPVTFVGIKGN